MPTMTLTWQPSDDNVAVDHYRIYRRIAPAPWPDPLVVLTTRTTTTFSETIGSSETRVYMVQAVDAAGNPSALSDTKQAYGGATSDQTSAPQSLVLDFATSTDIRMSWTAPSSIPGTISAYIIYRDGAEFSFTAPDDLTFRDFDVPAGNHTYNIVARSGGNVDSALSNTLTASTGGDTTPPSPPSNLIVTSPNSTTIVLDWNASTDNVGVKDYVIARQTGGSGAYALLVTVNHPNTILMDTGRTPGQTYRYQIVARDVALNSSSVSTSAAIVAGSGTGETVYNVPATPTNFTNVETGAVESYHVDCTGLTDCTLSFRRWMREAVPNGTLAARTKVVFPTTGGTDGGTALLWMESGIRMNTRHHILLKGNGARIVCRTKGSWVTYQPEANEPNWPTGRKQFVIRNCINVRAEDFDLYGHHWRGNPGHVPTVDPYETSYSMRIHIQNAGGISAGATSIDVEKTLKGRPIKYDEWWSTTWAGSGPGFNGSMAKNYQKPFDGYFLYIGTASGTNPNYESILVTADVAHPTVAGWRRLTVVRGRNQPWGVAARAWPQGTNMGPGRIGGWGGQSGSPGYSMEFQHGFTITRGGPGAVGSDCSVHNCISRYPGGSNFEVSDDALRTTITDCWADHGGRQGLTPNACTDLFVENLTINDVAWSAIDIEPAANTTKVRDVVIKGTDTANPMRVNSFGGAFLGNGGRGRGNEGSGGIAGDGRYFTDNIVLKDIVSNGSIGVRGDRSPTSPGGPRGTHTFLRLSGSQVWGSPVEMMKLFRCKGVTIKGVHNRLATTQNRHPMSLNAKTTGYNSAGVEVEVIAGTDHVVQNSVRTSAGGSIGRAGNQVPGTDNDYPGALSDWRGTYEGY